MIAPPTVPAPTAVTISVPLGADDARSEEEANRAMSVDEQIDLEQQADFFIALGHDDAAIDLLMAHMRSTGGGSPLPFLKLLEIHRRRDQREAYERTRVRFNQRFNSVAPDWQADPKAGRTLEDYPLAVGRIQRAWPVAAGRDGRDRSLCCSGAAPTRSCSTCRPTRKCCSCTRWRATCTRRRAARCRRDVDVLLPIGGRSAPVAVARGHRSCCGPSSTTASRWRSIST